MDPRAERFFRAVLARSGFADRAECEPAIRAVLAPLGTRLSDDDLAAVSEELPHAVAAYLDRRARSEGPASDFVADVADAEGIDVGFAREHAGVVLTALCDQLSPNAQTILRGAVEPEFRSLFERREPTDKMTPRHDGRSSLASGKAGSAHPVSEYGRDRSQSRSVVQSDNPHGDTKLSSSEGTTQEREDETLAEGRPPRGLDR